MISTTLLLTFLCLLSASSLTAVGAAFHRLGRLQVEERFKKKNTSFFFHRLLPFFFGQKKWGGLFFSLSATNNLLRIGFALFACGFLFEEATKTPNVIPFDSLFFPVAILSIFLLSFLCDFFSQLLGQLKPQATIHFLAPISSFLLLVCTPITSLFFWAMRAILRNADQQKRTPVGFDIRDKVYEVLQESELGAYLDPNEQKFILSIVSFKERIAREVMVPRIHLFSLPSETTVNEAAYQFLKEGYSRIPVYQESVDHIIGVLLYKDILKLYIEQEQHPHLLQTPIEKWIKPILYTPETKKISHLLQEFRNKQIHLAIVVDEWGGTEGIVTIEDILEELVGEIADEYDAEPQSLYSPLSGGGWLVDAKMSIIDIQGELGIKIPQSPEYDTIGGYVFHRAGSIPTRGWKIHHDEFDLEVMSSSERSVKKIKITTTH